MTKPNFAADARQIYQTELKDLAASCDAWRHAGELAAANELRNPFCGDRVRLAVVWDAQGSISELQQQVKGCLLCKAATAMLAQWLPGRSLAEFEVLHRGLRALLHSEPSVATPELLRPIAPVAAHASRHGCVLLPFECLTQILNGRG